MNKKTLLVLTAVFILAAVAVAAFVLRPPAEASAPIEAPALVPNTAQPVAEAPAVEQPTAEEPAEQPTAATEVAATAEAPATAAVILTSSNLTIFTIVQSESQVRFSINEELRNAPVTAVGITDQVAGQIGIDFEQPANSQIGTILINARTLKTDSEFRNRAIKNQILKSNQYEFISFTPTAISGLPESAAVGDSFTLQVSGDLTITDITAPASFEVTVILAADGRLEGFGVATVLRSTYDLKIPNVDQVANVSDEVLLEIVFVAVTE